MSQRIYVGNLPPNAGSDEVRELFSEFGAVEWVNLVIDTATGRSRGFGYVKMAGGVEAAIRALDRRPLGGRLLDVKPALPVRDRDLTGPRMPKRARHHPPAEAHPTFQTPVLGGNAKPISPGAR